MLSEEKSSPPAEGSRGGEQMDSLERSEAGNYCKGVVTHGDVVC